MELKQHPLSAAFPGMTDDEFDQLVEDIKSHGQREPIIVHEGMVLDGWHRYRACVGLGIEPKRFTFAIDGDPVAFVLSQNLHRRHLTPSQRAAAIVACTDYGGHGGTRKGQSDQGANLPLDPKRPKVEELAKAAQVAPRLIKDAATAKRAGLLDEVKDGVISATAAADMARGKEAKPAKPKGKPPEPGSKKDAQLQAIKAVQAQEKAQEQAEEMADQLAEAQHTIVDLAAENDRLNDRLAVEAMDASEEEKTAAAESIKALRAQVKTLEVELSAVKSSRDTYMRENAELKKQCAYWRKQAEKAAKEAA